MDIVFVIELVGTVAFALSGALVAIENKYDLFGVAVLASTTATGGGIMRDIILGNTPPTAFQKPIYIFVAILTAIGAFLYAKYFRHQGKMNQKKFDALFYLFDAVGLGLFTVTSMNNALLVQSNGFLCVFVGMLAGIGGGILRDILAQRKPVVLRKYIYAMAALVGAIFYFFLLQAMDREIAMLLAAGIIVCIRLLSIRYGWNLPTA